MFFVNAYRFEQLLNGLIRIEHFASGLTCCLNEDFTHRFGDLPIPSKSIIDKARKELEQYLNQSIKIKI